MFTNNIRASKYTNASANGSCVQAFVASHRHKASYKLLVSSRCSSAFTFSYFQTWGKFLFSQTTYITNWGQVTYQPQTTDLVNLAKVHSGKLLKLDWGSTLVVARNRSCLCVRKAGIFLVFNYTFWRLSIWQVVRPLVDDYLFTTSLDRLALVW